MPINSRQRTKVAVIGSGFGGLSCAIRLQSQGFDVEIFEKRDKPGGRAYYYEESGYRFDAGPTVVTAPHCLYELWELAGRNLDDYVRLKPVTPLYRLHWEDRTTFDYTDDLSKTLEQIEKIRPEDAKRYPEFLQYTKQVFEAGYSELAHVPFLNWWSMIRVSPDLMKLQAFRSVYAMVSKYLKDPKLREAFSFHSLLVGGNPFSASSIYTLIHYLERKWGVYYPEGGVNRLVAAMVKLFEELGGKLHTGVEIDEILSSSGKISGLKTKSGERIPFDAVVSNADVVRTYSDLLRDEPKVRLPRWRLERAHYSMSLFLVYFGTKRRYREIQHHNVMFGARYKGLLDDIFRTGKLANDFSLYVHAPSQDDPSVAPEGGEAMYALSPVPHLGKYQEDWRVMGPKYADRILGYLEKHYLPNLRNEIVVQRIFTPLDFQYELNAHLGSAFSLEPRLTQSAYFRVHNRERRLNGMYFVGAGTHPGAGIPGVVNSAKATAGLMLGDYRKKSSVSVAVTMPEVLPERVSNALTQCREMISVGSKSFSMAAKLFRPQMRDAAFFLYGWCRYCDDQIDKPVNRRLQEQRVSDLYETTAAAFKKQEFENPVFTALSHIAGKYSIPSHYALELIEGMRMDVRKERYETMEELSLYCYRVAGVVGLMMSHVMGVSEEKALRNAADMGIAMQLTNIARDVIEDAAMGRVYLPLQWLDEAGVPEAQIALPRFRQAVFQVVARLLAHADKYYQSGNSGLKYLPFRAAIAVGVASSVYWAIGRKVLRRKAKAWDSRTFVGKWGKAWALCRGLGLALSTIPYRIMNPWRVAPLTQIWRHAYEP